jgi:hypothetical protein
MPKFAFLFSEIRNFLPLILVSASLLMTLKLVQWLWLGKRINRFSDQKIVPQIIMLLFANVGVICIILALAYR